ncbi:MAG: FtsX-like permease family protein [Flavobacteriaceae bacterium]
MILTSLKIALRGFLRNRFFTSFNLLSLVAGLFVAFVAISYIGFEYSYDAFHENSKNIYRLARTSRSQDYSVVGFEKWNETDAATQKSQITALKNVPGVKNAVQFITSENLEYVEGGGNRVQEKGFLTTNTPAEFVTLFTWKPIAGSLSDFGTAVGKVMLTKSSAFKIFGDLMDNPSLIIGEAIKIGEESFEVAAIIEDVPLNSHFDFSMAVGKPRIDYWGSRIYLGLSDNTSYTEVEQQINASMASINPSIVKDPLYKKHFLQPLEDIHLKSNILYELKPPGNYSFILLIGGFALFILVITLFNYANFTLAIKSKQGKSIGIKKAMGALNFSIALQFLVEGVLLALIALPILALLIALVVPSFNELMGVDLNTNLLEDPMTLVLLVTLAVVLGLLASIAPAVFLSWKDTLSLFKENLRDNRFQHFSIRKYLIVSQFVILISITSISYFVMRQMDYIENKDIGFQKEGILYAYTSPEKQDIFQERLRQVPGIKYVGNGSSFGIGTYNQMTYKLQNEVEVFDDANQLYLDYEALKAYNIKTDLNAFNSTGRITLINRTAAEKFANVKNVDPEALIGTLVITEPEYIAEDGQVGIPFEIAGIFEDINVFSLREKVAPYFITVSPNVRMAGRTIVSYDTEETSAITQQIQQVYEEINEAYPLETEFLTQNLQELYLQDQQTANLVFWMNILAVILAAMGIIGITIFLVIARTKEIGIRRVLGATEFHIIKSTVKEYILFIAIALLISWPIALYGSNRWLSNFAYRIEVQHIVFLAVGLLTFIGTAFLVGLVALKASMANPAKSLRNE